MVRTLVDMVRKGERVMGVVGCRQVIRPEGMLRAALGAPLAPQASPRALSAKSYLMLLAANMG